MSESAFEKKTASPELRVPPRQLVLTEETEEEEPQCSDRKLILNTLKEQTRLYFLKGLFVLESTETNYLDIQINSSKQSRADGCSFISAHPPTAHPAGCNLGPSC